MTIAPKPVQTQPSSHHLADTKQLGKIWEKKGYVLSKELGKTVFSSSWCP